MLNNLNNLDLIFFYKLFKKYSINLNNLTKNYLYPIPE